MAARKERFRRTVPLATFRDFGTRFLSQKLPADLYSKHLDDSVGRESVSVLSAMAPVSASLEGDETRERVGNYRPQER